MSEGFDVIVIGAGIAGASLAARLAGAHRVAVLEREEQAGAHATGRSAAVFTTLYGNAVIRDLTLRSRDELTAVVSRDGAPILHRCGTLFVADHDQRESLARLRATLADDAVAAEVAPDEALRLCPILRPEKVAAAIHEPGSASVDVDALLQHYLHDARTLGTRVATGVAIRSLKREGGEWRVTTQDGDLRARVVVNAAGAWADQVAVLAGAAALGIQPFRRTAVLVDAAGHDDVADWPLVLDIDERFYFKPFGNQLMVSPADETPCEPQDAQPEDIDVAIAVDRLETATRLPVRRIAGKWAGLRSFAPDRTPVVGFDRDREGLFWLAGQGGYGIQTAPALARIAADLIAGRDDVAHAAALSPRRLIGYREDRVA